MLKRNNEGKKNIKRTIYFVIRDGESLEKQKTKTNLLFFHQIKKDSDKQKY